MVFSTAIRRRCEKTRGRIVLYWGTWGSDSSAWLGEFGLGQGGIRLLFGLIRRKDTPRNGLEGVVEWAGDTGKKRLCGCSDARLLMDCQTRVFWVLTSNAT